MIDTLARVHTEYLVTHYWPSSIGGVLQKTEKFTNEQDAKAYIRELVARQERNGEIIKIESREREVFASPWVTREV